MININNLEVQYDEGDFRLSIPELTVPQAEKTAFIGPSGSGKTTRLSLVAGIFLPQEGMVTVDAFTISKLNDSERRNFCIVR